MKSLTAQAWLLCYRAQCCQGPREATAVPGGKPQSLSIRVLREGSVCSIPKTSEILSAASGLQQRWEEGAGLPCPPTGRRALFNEKHYVGGDKGPDGRRCCFLTSPWHSWSPSHSQV